MRITSKITGLLMAAFFICSMQLKAQEGHFLSIFGGGQQVGIDNADDYIAYGKSDVLNRVNTFRYTGGLLYHYNFAPYYGIQTGLYLSQQGQKYEGRNTYDVTTKDSAVFPWKSHVYTSYLRVPLLMRFNSALDPQDRVGLSLMAGCYFSYLLGIDEIYNDHPSPDSAYQKWASLDVNSLYKKFEFGLSAAAQVNVRLSNRLYTFIGVKFDRSITNVEDLSSPKDLSMPGEYLFPLSTRKTVDPDYLTRNQARNVTISAFVGLTFRFAGSGNVVPAIQPPDAGEGEDLQ